MQKISGIEISKKIIARLKRKPVPKRAMAAVVVGNDPITLNFVKEKEKAAKELGLKFEIHRLSKDLKLEELRRRVNKIAARKDVGGIIVQLPLPPHIEKHEILKDIPAEKDVDVLGARASSAFYVKEGGVLPPSCGVVDEICKRLKINLAKTKVAIVGLGLLVGKPLAIYMLHRAKDTALLASKSDIKEITKADLIVSGVGKSRLISPRLIKKSATVIDFGYDYEGGRLTGDFDHSSIKNLSHVKHYTPTPGGTGPILVAKLFENFYKLNENI